MESRWSPAIANDAREFANIKHGHSALDDQHSFYVGGSAKGNPRSKPVTINFSQYIPGYKGIHNQ